MGWIGGAVLEFIFLFILPLLGCSIRWIVYLCIGNKQDFEQLFKDQKTNCAIGFIIFIILFTTIIFLVN